MTDDVLLAEVKGALGITGDFQDGPLRTHIRDVKEYLIDGGVKESVINSRSSVGVIIRGVTDLWDYGSGQGKLSSYFMMRATQLAYKKEDTEDG